MTQKASIMSSKEEIHPDIWRTCNKIRAAVAQKNVSLWDILSPLDPQKDSLVSESEFCNAVRQAIGLSDLEAAQVAAHFRANGGRILYRQFCSLIHGQDAPCPAEVQPQWADAQHVRELSQCEERRLCMLLRKLAAAVAARRLILRPYFYDYELVISPDRYFVPHDYVKGRFSTAVNGQSLASGSAISSILTPLFS